MMIRKLESTQDEFGRTLQLCLELIESGRETVDSLLSRYPSTCETLRPPLEAAAWLYNHNHLLNPHPGFVDASRRRLVYHVCQGSSFLYITPWFENQQLIRRDLRERKKARPSIAEIHIAVLIIFNLHPIRTSEPAVPLGLLTKKGAEHVFT